MNDKLATTQQPTLAQPVEDEPQTFMQFLARASRDPGFDVAKFEALMQAKERTEAREAERLYNVDMAALQSELEPIAKSGVNSYLNSKYVKLEDLLAVTKPLFEKYGFAPGFDSKHVGASESREGAPVWIEFSCEMKHRAGHSKTNHLTLPIDGTGSKGGKSQMNAIQSVGSTTSYARRYLLEMHLNLSRKGEDNDGAGAEELVHEKDAAEIDRMLADRYVKIGVAHDDGAEKCPCSTCRFFRFMSMGQPVPFRQAKDIPARDFKRAVDFFNAPGAK